MTRANDVPDPDRWRRMRVVEVRVEREETGVVGDEDDLGAVGEVADERDAPCGRREHRRAEWCGDVEAVVEVRIGDAVVRAGRLERQGGRAEALTHDPPGRPDPRQGALEGRTAGRGGRRRNERIDLRGRGQLGVDQVPEHADLRRRAARGETVGLRGELRKEGVLRGERVGEQGEIRLVTGEVRPLRFELGLDPPEIEERRVLSVRERSEGARRDERRQDRPGRQEHLERGAL